MNIFTKIANFLQSGSSSISKILDETTNTNTETNLIIEHIRKLPKEIRTSQQSDKLKTKSYQLFKKRFSKSQILSQT